MVRSQVGSHRDFKIDDTGLKVRTYISKTPETLHAIKLIEDGSLNTYSMGGIFTYGRDEDGTMCIIEKVDLFEGSIVVIPANPQAQFVKKSFLEKAKELPSSADDGKPKQVPKKELTKDEKAKNIIKKMKGKK
jgi:phage head maturation protease